jgi:hypothetical protein
MYYAKYRTLEDGSREYWNEAGYWTCNIKAATAYKKWQFKLFKDHEAIYGPVATYNIKK